MYEWLNNWLMNLGTPDLIIRGVNHTLGAIIFFSALFMTSWVLKHTLVPVIEKAIRRTSNTWDDTLIANGFFSRLAHLLTISIAYFSIGYIFPGQAPLASMVEKLCMALFVLLSVRAIDALLMSSLEISGRAKGVGKKSIRSYIDAFKIITYLLAGIFLVSILTDKSPWGILSVFGGLTAVLLLIFKDTILGFVAGLQLSAHDMVRVGDWIEMPKFEADGDVIEVNIHTVKVKNWDKTISTIPTYALVTNSFKNWRGMSESGGRRIKRSLTIDMNSIMFCTDEMIDYFSRYAFLRDYIPAKQEEIDAHNQELGLDTSMPVNGRRQTNIGVFRAYIIGYLRSHPKIHQDMTFLVRQLQPTAEGLPLEIYVFSNDQAWANYEAIQADIFDHILAAIPEFGLRVFQYPSGHDLKSLTVNRPGAKA
ncbi:mechanosensitive ion channel family protein [Thermodesulfobacteriota bacterium]